MRMRRTAVGAWLGGAILGAALSLGAAEADPPAEPLADPAEPAEVAGEDDPLGAELRALEEEQAAAAEALDPLEEEVRRAAAAAPADPSALWSRPVGPVQLRLLDLSVDLLVAGGGSTADDATLQTLQGGGHDPRKNGFTLQNLELFLAGAVDPYFTAEINLIYFIDPAEGESVFELEEAFATSLWLPFGLNEAGFQLEVGQFFTEFGRINPRHPHSWEFLDQPVINSRVFGPDGIRNPGFRLAWLTPIPWFSELHFGLQNANGETASSFLASEEVYEERPIGGRPFVERTVRGPQDLVAMARWDNAWDLSDELSAKIGASGLTGPNATGPNARTWIYGTDVLLRWRPVNAERGWPFVSWQTEAIRRELDAAEFSDPGDPGDPGDDIFYPAARLDDWGVYTQVVWGFVRNWSVGLRFEYAGGHGDSVGDHAGRSEDPFRTDRYRVSPLLSWLPTEFSRVRLQYNYDRSDHLEDRDAHTVWVGLEVLFGQHPAHVY